MFVNTYSIHGAVGYPWMGLRGTSSAEKQVQLKNVGDEFLSWSVCIIYSLQSWYGYGSIPINTIFSGMNIHLPAILMFTRGTRFWHTAIYLLHVRWSLKKRLNDVSLNPMWFAQSTREDLLSKLKAQLWALGGRKSRKKWGSWRVFERYNICFMGICTGYGRLTTRKWWFDTV